ncbi:MAG: hypothetical protein ACFB02_07985 [Mastigocoleus sp.]
MILPGLRLRVIILGWWVTLKALFVRSFISEWSVKWQLQCFEIASPNGDAKANTTVRPNGHATQTQ